MSDRSVSPIVGDAVTGDALYSRADAALFHAKRSGRDRTVRHDPAQRLGAEVAGTPTPLSSDAR